MADKYWIDQDAEDDRLILFYDEDPNQNPDAEPVATGHVPDGYTSYEDWGKEYETGDPTVPSDLAPYDPDAPDGGGAPGSSELPDPAAEEPGGEPGGEPGPGDGEPADPGEGDTGEPSAGDTGDIGGVEEGDYGAGGREDGVEEPPEDPELNLDDAIGEEEEEGDDIGGGGGYSDNNSQALDDARDEAEAARARADKLDELARQVGQSRDVLDENQQSLAEDIAAMLDRDPLADPSPQDQVEDNLLQPQTVVDPVRPFSGSYVRRETDVSVPCAWGEFLIERFYDNQIYTVGMLGPKWRLNLEESVFPFASGRVQRVLGDGRALVYAPDPANPAGGLRSPDGWSDVLERRGTGWRVTDAQGGQRSFNASGRLTEIRDRHGNRAVLTYEAGRLAKVTDPCGREFVFTHDADGKLLGLGDPAGGGTQYKFNAGCLAAVYPPDAAPGLPGPSLTYEYADGPDPRMRHNLTVVRDHAGDELLRNEYGLPNEAFNRVVGQEIDGGTYRLAYVPGGAGGRRLQITNPLGYLTAHDFDREGCERVREEWTAGLQPGAPQKYVRTFAYSPTGLIAAATTPGGGVIEFTHDEGNGDFLARTNLIAVRRRPRAGAPDAESPLTRYAYGAFSQPVRILDALGRATDLTLDAAGNAVRCELPPRTLADGSVVRPVIRTEYDARGLVVRRVEPDGLATALTYFTTAGRRGLLRRVTRDPGGVNAVYESAFDLMGRPTQERQPDTDLLEHRYDGRGRRTHLLRSGRELVKWGYDRHDRVISIAEHRLEPGGAPANPEWTELQMEYDNRRRLAVSRVVAGGTTLEEVHYTHDVLGRMVRVQGPGTRDRLNGYDERDQLLAVTLAAGSAAEARWRYEYDADGNVVAAITPRQHRFEQRFNGLRQLQERVDATGNRDGFSYDLAGNITRVERRDVAGVPCRLGESVVNAGGEVTALRRARLDAAGQVLGWVTDEFLRDVMGRVVRQVGANGAATTAQFDLLGRETQTTDPAGNVQRMTYDAAGRLLQALREEVLPGGNLARIAHFFAWDGDGRLARISDSAGRIQRQFFDSLGQLRRVVLADGTERITEYDALRRVTANTVRNPANGASWTERLRYSAEGFVEQLQDAAGRITRFTCDAQGRVLRVEDPAGGLIAAYGYDANGNVTHAEDARGVKTLQSHDALNRIRSRGITKPAAVFGAQKETFDYDANGNLTAAANEFGEVRFSFDSLGALTGTVVNGREVRRSYQADGSLAGVHYPCGLDLGVSLDSLGRVKQVDGALAGTAAFPGQAINGPVAKIDYAGRAWRTQLETGNGVASRWSYDFLGRPVGLETAAGAVRLRREAGLRDSLDRVILGAEEGGDAQRFSRDPRGMLAASEPVQKFTDVGPITQVAPLSGTVPSPVAARAPADFTRALTAGTTPTTRYAYDDAGNRTKVTDATGTFTHTIGVRDEITGGSGPAPAWDAAGNLADDGRFTFGYDAANRLCQVKEKAGGALLYEANYDPLGRVVSTREPAGDRLWYYDGGMAVERGAAGQAPDLALVWGPGMDNLLLQAQAGRNNFAHPDLHGNVALLTDATGAVVEKYSYDSWGGRGITDGAGQRLARSQAGNAFGYISRPHLEGTPLLDLRARAYHAGLGRFVSRDPSGYGSGINLYLYGRNDPLTLADHNGMFPEMQAETVETIWGAVHVVGGVFEVVSGAGLAASSAGFGVAASWTGVGAVAGVAGIAAGSLVVAHGTDQIVAGFRQMASGEQTDSGTSWLLQNVVGMSKETANRVDTGIGVAGSLGAGLANAGIKLAAIKLLPEAQGLSSLKVMSNWEAGSRALNNADFAALGGAATSPLAKQVLMEAGKDAAGGVYKLTTTRLQGFVKAFMLAHTGITPRANVLAGLVGAGGNLGCRK